MRRESRGHAARLPEAIRPEAQEIPTTRSRTDTLAHRRSHGHPATHANPGRNANLRVSVLKRFARHSTAVVPLWMAAWSRHGSPNPALVHGRCYRTSPVGSIYGGGFVRQYVNNICPDIIEQITCLGLSCESFFGKILSYIVWGCTLGLMSAERIMESRSLSRRPSATTDAQ